MSTGILGMVTANIATLLVSYRLIRPLRTGDAPTDAVIFLLVRLLLISACVLIAGLSRQLTGPVLGTVGAVAILIVVLFRACPITRVLTGIIVDRLAAGVSLLLAVRLILQVWFFAPHSTDVLSYHLPKVAEWVRSAGFGTELGLDNHGTFPAGFELIETWWVVFLHHDVLIEMAGVEFLVLAFAAAYALARSFELSPRNAWWAGIVYTLTPGLSFQATSCLNDGPVAAILVACAALIVRKAPVPVILAAFALGVGIKATAVYAAPGMVLLYWWLGRKETRAAGVTLAVSAGLLALALATGGYWYLRNAIRFGNPIYPIGDQTLPIQAGPRLSSLLGNAGALVNARLYDRGPYGAYLDGITGWGGIAFACGLLGTILWSLENERVRRWSIAFGVSLAGVLLMSRQDEWYMRFCLFFPALLAIASVRLVERYPAILPCLVIAFLFQFLGTIVPYDLPRKQIEVLADQSWQKRSTSASFGFDVSDDAIGYFAENRGAAYCLYGPNYSRRVVYLRSSTAEELLEDMKREGLRRVCIAPLSHAKEEIVEECLRRERLRRESANVFLLR